MKEKAQKYLKDNSTVKQLYGTSDGFLFEKKQDANVHARTLEDQEVTVFTGNVAATEDAPTTAKNPKQEQAFDYDNKDKELLEDRTFLMARYEALKGEKATHNIGMAKLAERVQELEAELFGE